MKKVLLSACTVFAFTIASAQETGSTGEGFTKGETFISGTISYDSEKTGDFKNSQFTVAPKVGYFVSNNIALGIGIGYTSAKSDQVNEFVGFYEEKTTAFEAGVFGRYYFNPASKFSIYTELSAAYASAKSEADVPGSGEFKANGFNIQFAPGFNYFVSNHFALEASFGILGYSTVKPDYEGAESTDSFSIGLDLANVNFGILYKF